MRERAMSLWTGAKSEFGSGEKRKIEMKWRLVDKKLGGGGDKGEGGGRLGGEHGGGRKGAMGGGGGGGGGGWGE